MEDRYCNRCDMIFPSGAEEPVLPLIYVKENGADNLSKNLCVQDDCRDMYRSKPTSLDVRLE